jgi:UPF0716 protein FxsA
MRRRIGLAGLALFGVVVLEIALLVYVAHQIGTALTILLVLATSLLGAWLLRREGSRAWRALREASAAGRPVGAEVSDGLVGLASGLLLVVPGFVTDVLGLLLRLPPLRRGTRAVVRRLTERQVSSAIAGDLFGPRQVRVRVRRGATPEPGDPIEGEIVDR